MLVRQVVSSCPALLLTEAFNTRALFSLLVTAALTNVKGPLLLKRMKANCVVTGQGLVEEAVKCNKSLVGELVFLRCYHGSNCFIFGCEYIVFTLQSNPG